LRLELLCDRAGEAGASGAGASTIFLVFIHFSSGNAEADQKARAGRGFETRFWNHKRWGIQEPHIRIRIQDSTRVGIADRRNE
jgi:hypothetical protein